MPSNSQQQLLRPWVRLRHSLRPPAARPAVRVAPVVVVVAVEAVAAVAAGPSNFLGFSAHEHYS